MNRYEGIKKKSLIKPLRFRKAMRRTAAHSAKDRALLPVLCVTEASFPCWLIGLKSPTELCDARPVMKTGSSPARFVFSDSVCCLIFLDLLSFE